MTLQDVEGAEFSKAHSTDTRGKTVECRQLAATIKEFQCDVNSVLPGDRHFESRRFWKGSTAF